MIRKGSIRAVASSVDAEAAGERGRGGATEGDTEPDRGRDHEIELGVVEDRFAGPLREVDREGDTDMEPGEARREGLALRPGPDRPDRERGKNPLRPSDAADRAHDPGRTGREQIRQEYVVIDRDADREP